MSAFAKNSITVFVSDIFSNAIKILAGIIIARVLGPAGQGFFSLATLVVGFSVMLGSLGIEVAIIYLIGQRKYPVKAVVGNSLALGLFSSICLIIILFFINPFLIEKFLKGRHQSILLVAEFTIMFLMMQTIVLSTMLGQNKIVEYTRLKIFNSIIYILLVAILLIGLKLNLIGGIIAYLVAPLFTLLLGIYILWKAGDLSAPSFSKDITIESLKYSLKGYIGTLSQYFNYRLDIFLVAYFLDLSYVGFYTIAVMVAEAIWYIPNSISTVFFPKVASSSFDSNNERTPIVSRNTLLITLFACLAVFIISDFLIQMVFGDKYSFAVLPLKLLLPGIAALSIWKILANDLAGRGYPQYKSYTAGISLVVTILLDLIFIPRIGIAGAAIASTVAYTLSTVMMLYWFCKITGLRSIDVIVPTMGDIRFYTAALKAMR